MPNSTPWASRLVLTFLGAGALCSSIAAQQKLEPPTEALIFKSGQSCLRRSVTVEPQSRKTRLRLPEALHGTVWLGSESVTIESATAQRATIREARPVEDMAGMLLRAMGKKVRLVVQHGQASTPVYPTGVIERVLLSKRSTNLRQVYYAGSVPSVQATSAASPSVVVLRSEANTSVYQVSSVVGMQVEDPEFHSAPWEYQQEVEVSVLDVAHSAADAAAGGRVLMDAMSDGLAWTPSYVLEMGEAGKARLVGKAVVVNDAEALFDTRLRLVIGFPNLKFASVDSSLRPEVSLDAFRQMLNNGGGRRGQSDSPFAMSQVVSNVGIAGVSPSVGSSGPSQPLAGESAEDLFVYDMGTVTVGKGARVYLPMLEAEADVEHRYDWELPDRVDSNGRLINDREPKPTPPVWHVLKLKNDTDAPWTTAPILIQGKRGPLAQSMLTYTPVGSDVTVRLTKALDITGRVVETRVGAEKPKRADSVFFGLRYEPVEIQGRIEVINRSNKDAPMRVRKAISGDLLSVQQNPMTSNEAKDIRSVNVKRSLTWTFSLAAGETWTTTYRYRVQVRR